MTPLEPPWIFIATHMAEAHGPQYMLRDYLARQGRAFAYAAAPFDYARIPAAELTVYQNGRPIQTLRGHKNNTRGPVSWIRDFLTFFIWGARHGRKDAVFIGINNLNTLAGLLLRALGRCRHVVYYIIDYTPRRFPSRLLNALYQGCARAAARHADMVWNISRPIQEKSAEFGARRRTNLVVPIGIDKNEVRVVPEQEIARWRLVIVSTLFESKGVQLAIEAMRFMPEAELHIVGTGPYQARLHKLAAETGTASRITFHGLLSRQDLVATMAASRVALAPYQQDASNYSYYADPAKIKEYLSCGLPTVITRVPWIAAEIADKPMGVAIDYDARQLAAACRRLAEDDVFWRQCRAQALAFVQGMDWETIFGEALEALAALDKPAAASGHP